MGIIYSKKNKDINSPLTQFPAPANKIDKSAPISLYAQPMTLGRGNIS
jgi:hypothetical protein